jgi:hypothetical protein
MDISSVNTSSVQQTPSLKRAEEAKQVQSEAAQTKAQEVKKVSDEQAKPVINGQGQTIGGRLNVTA